MLDYRPSESLRSTQRWKVENKGVEILAFKPTIMKAGCKQGLLEQKKCIDLPAWIHEAGRYIGKHSSRLRPYIRFLLSPLTIATRNVLFRLCCHRCLNRDILELMLSHSVLTGRSTFFFLFFCWQTEPRQETCSEFLRSKERSPENGNRWILLTTP